MRNKLILAAAAVAATALFVLANGYPGPVINPLNTQDYSQLTIHGLNLDQALPLVQGGTGSRTENFVDLYNTQSISGDKGFLGNVSVSKVFTNLGISNFYGLSNQYGGSNIVNGLTADNLTDSALTSGRCVQAGAGGLLGVAAGACATTGVVTAVTASAPLASSGGVTPNITISATPSFTNVTASSTTGFFAGGIALGSAALNTNGSGIFSFFFGTTNEISLQAGVPGSTSGAMIQSFDTTNCPNTSTNKLFDLVAATGATNLLDVQCNGSMLSLGASISHTIDTNGAFVETYNATPGTTVGSAAYYANTLDATNCGTASANLAFAYAAQGVLVLKGTCAGNVTVQSILNASTLNSTGNITYSKMVIQKSACGTLIAPLADNAASCGGDAGFTTAATGAARVNFTAFSDANHYECWAFDTTTHTYAGITNIANTSASQCTVSTSGASDVVQWHIIGVSGG